MSCRFLLALAFFATSILPLKHNPVQADDSAVDFLRSVAESVQAAKNKFPTVEAKGTTVFQSKVLKGKPGLASRGEPSNSTVKCSLQYLHRDFGLTRRIILVPESGASPGYRSPTRDVHTPNYSLDADDQATGYVRPAPTDNGEFGNFAACFWIPGEGIQNIAPEPTVDSSRFKLDTNIDGTKECTFAFTEDTELAITFRKYGNSFLPTNYAYTSENVLLTEHSWVWKMLPSGNYYPQKYSSQMRLNYPAQDDAVELTRTEIEFVTVTENLTLTDETFSFAALGLSPGSIVYDVRDAKETRFEFQPQSGDLLGLIEKPIPAEYQTIPMGLSRPFHWVRMSLLAVVFVLALGAFGYFLRPRSS